MTSILTGIPGVSPTNSAVRSFSYQLGGYDRCDWYARRAGGMGSWATFAQFRSRTEGASSRSPVDVRVRGGKEWNAVGLRRLPSVHDTSEALLREAGWAFEEELGGSLRCPDDRAGHESDAPVLYHQVSAERAIVALKRSLELDSAASDSRQFSANCLDDADRAAYDERAAKQAAMARGLAAEARRETKSARGAGLSDHDEAILQLAWSLFGAKDEAGLSSLAAQY